MRGSQRERVRYSAVGQLEGLDSWLGVLIRPRTGAADEDGKGEEREKVVGHDESRM